MGAGSLEAFMDIASLEAPCIHSRSLHQSSKPPKLTLNQLHLASALQEARVEFQQDKVCRSACTVGVWACLHTYIYIYIYIYLFPYCYIILSVQVLLLLARPHRGAWALPGGRYANSDAYPGCQAPYARGS